MTSTAPSPTPVRTVVVLGLARSGTSVVTGILRILGVDMGPALEDNSNPRGSNEDIDFARLHKEIFDLTGAARDYWSPPSREEIRGIGAKVDPAVRELIAKKSRGNALWGWKHPRTVLACELFLPYLVNPHFVFVCRNVFGTASSAVEHTRRRPKPLSFSEALRLVHFYQGEMLACYSSHPDIPAHFLAYEDVVDDPVRETEKLAQFLDVKFTQDIGRQVAKLVIPRERLPDEKRKMRSFLRGKLPRLIRKWSR